jgi:VWFA-related protein
MKKVFSQLLLIALFLASFTVWNFAQDKPAPLAVPTPPVEEDTDVVKISTALIQLDVVVTDKSGKLVTDLKPEDFEISENGERQTITNATYLATQKSPAGDVNLNILNGTNQTMPSVGEVRRTVGIVIDDAGLSAQSINLVKKDLVKFISEQMQPGDLLAVIKTSGSVGVLQQFTTDKKKLLDIIDNLKFQPLTGSGLSPFEPISVSFAEQILTNSGGGQLSDKARNISEQKNDIESLANISKNIRITSGSLGVLNSTISAISTLPGRKSVLYIAEGIASIFTGGINSSVESLGGRASVLGDRKELEDKLRGITEFANRATIAIYALDPRGVLTTSFSASDMMRGGMTDREMKGLDDNKTNVRSNDKSITDKSDYLKASQQGMKFLAEETSGKAFINTNDLGKSLRDTLDSQNGYYIVGYQPDAETFNADKRKFNKLSIKVKRPNVNISYRSGFFNVAETEGEKFAAAPERVFLQKLFSPYKSSDVNLQMTSIFAADEKVSTVRSFINIEPKSLQFTDAADGTKIANLDVVAVSFNEDGIPVSQVAKRFDVKVSKAGYEKLLQDGIACSLAFATKTKGTQQIKVAVRDVNTNKIGTASQTIILPDFDKNKMNLSGIVLQNFSVQEWQNVTGGKPPTDAATRMQTNTAQRKFKKGTVLSFNYAVYAAPSLNTKSQAQFTVFKDGKEIFKGAPEDLTVASNGKMQRVNKGGAFMLGTDMAAGKYILKISVSGDALKEAEIQQIDFELMN